MSRGSLSISYADISADEEADLVSRCAAGDRDAAQVLIDAHRSTINVVARRYARGRLTQHDAAQAACVGLLEATKRYTAIPGVRFISYARASIEHEAREAHRKSMPAAPSRWFLTRLHRAEKSGERLPEDVDAARSLLSTDSLDAPPRVGDRDGFTLHDVVHDGEPSPEEVLTHADVDARRWDLVKSAMAELSAREREVLRRRYLQEEPEEFAEIGAAVGINRWRAREIAARALPKLRAAIRAAMAPDDEVLFEIDRHEKRAA